MHKVTGMEKAGLLGIAALVALFGFVPILGPVVCAPAYILLLQLLRVGWVGKLINPSYFLLSMGMCLVYFAILWGARRVEDRAGHKTRLSVIVVVHTLCVAYILNVLLPVL